VLAAGGVAALAASSSAFAADATTIDNPVNLAGQGFVAVTVPNDVDSSTARLGAGSDPGLAPIVTTTTGEGQLVLRFDKQKLVERGLLDGATKSLHFQAKTTSGGSVSADPAVTSDVELDVKFAADLQVRGANASISSLAGKSITPIDDLLAQHPGAKLEPLVGGMSQSAVAGLAAKAKARSGKTAPDMASWYRLTLPGSVDSDAVLGDLEAMPQVATAEAVADPAPPPSTTPDFSSQQDYLRPAPLGIDADFSRRDPRARGAGVRIADLEYYWTSDHEDLQLTPANDLGGDQYKQYTAFGDEHGTAVFGEMAAKDNGYGVTGGVPDASMNGISPSQTSGRYNPAGALVYVADKLSPGDAVLIEQQTVGPDGGTAYVPLEWTQAGFDAMKMLNDLGIIVVETGGNGYENLDAPQMLGRFDRTVRDSGAIVVGAGSSTDHSPLAYSSWGSRLDLEGVGQNVVTTGFNGNLFGGTAPANLNVRYTRSFSGTSSSGPIVTDAVVAVQSYVKATGQAPLTATQMSNLLKSTGTPQGGDPTHRTGEFPNIQAALKKIEVDAPTSTGTVAADGTVTITAEDGWGSGVAKIEYRADGGSWTTYGGPFKPAAGTHELDFRAVDANGNAEAPHTLTFAVDAQGQASGTVPATLSLTLGAPASFGSFAAGVDATYTASTTATVLSTAGDATLTVSDPSSVATGHLVNGAFSLPQPLLANGSALPAAVKAYNAPASNDPVSIGFSQKVGAGDALRTGTYEKTLVFTLSTTTP